MCQFKIVLPRAKQRTFYRTANSEFWKLLSLGAVDFQHDIYVTVAGLYYTTASFYYQELKWTTRRPGLPFLYHIHTVENLELFFLFYGYGTAKKKRNLYV